MKNMKRIVRALFLSVLLSVLALPTLETIGKDNKNAAKMPPALKEGEWELVFEDEFTGAKLDSKKWAPCPEWKRCDGFIQWSDKNYRLNGKGQFVLNIERRDGKLYSGALRTKGIYEQKFGYFEVRCKVPKIHGGWTAFWMMPANGNKVGDKGRDGTEIDIFESIMGFQGVINHALHWDGYGEHHKKTVKKFPKRDDLYDGEFHTFACLWNEKGYGFYIDGKESWRTSAGGVMRTPGYMKLTMEASSWAGKIAKQKLPVEWEIDYVRSYQLTKRKGK